MMWIAIVHTAHYEHRTKPRVCWRRPSIIRCMCAAAAAAAAAG